jgi:hypothetical protein
MIFHYFNISRRFVVLKRLFFSLIPLYTALFFMYKGEALTIMQLKPEFSAPFYTFISEGLNFCIGLGLYIFLWLGYCQFYFIIDRSISVRFMIEINESPHKALSFKELKELYSPDYIFRRRLDQMVDNGHLEIKNGKYINTAKGKIEGRLFKFLKELLRLGPGG